MEFHPEFLDDEFFTRIAQIERENRTRSNYSIFEIIKYALCEDYEWVRKSIFDHKPEFFISYGYTDISIEHAEPGFLHRSSKRPSLNAPDVWHTDSSGAGSETRMITNNCAPEIAAFTMRVLSKEAETTIAQDISRPLRRLAPFFEERRLNGSTWLEQAGDLVTAIVNEDGKSVKDYVEVRDLSISQLAPGVMAVGETSTIAHKSAPRHKDQDVARIFLRAVRHI